MTQTIASGAIASGAGPSGASAPTKLVRAANPLRKALAGMRLISRDVAVGVAEKNVETLHEDHLAGLKREIEALERLFPGASPQHSAEVFARGIEQSQVLYNLAGMLGFGALQSVAASLHDVLAALSARGLYLADPVNVHVRAVRLTAPGMPPLSAPDERRLLGQLAMIVAHFEA